MLLQLHLMSFGFVHGGITCNPEANSKGVGCIHLYLFLCNKQLFAPSNAIANQKQPTHDHVVQYCTFFSLRKHKTIMIIDGIM